MPILNVQVINNTTPNIQANVLTPTLGNSAVSSLTGVSYSQLIASLGTFIYSIYLFYIYTENQAQLNTPFLYYEFDATGNEENKALMLVPNEYFFSNANYLLIKNNEVILNGNSGFQFTILPNTSITLQLYAKTINNQGNGHDINFEFFEKMPNSKIQSIGFLNLKTML
jgi:hypothetical protein